jgi:transglutaminase/protease-like cytokinesis protein 3
MRRFLIILLSFPFISLAQDLDSLFHFEQDTIGLTKVIDEASMRWRDTVAKGNYFHIDKKILAMTGTYRTIPELASAITGQFSSKEDKVRAIFCWMTANIAYDCKEYHNETTVIKGPAKKKGTSKEAIAGKWEDAFFAYATQVLKKKKGVCEGYATLFFELCHCSGIDCEVVRGKVKRTSDGKVTVDEHAWNKVRFNDEWYYLDVCWASGTVDEKVTRFTRKLNNYYYITPLDRPYPTHFDHERKTRKRNELVGNAEEE